MLAKAGIEAAITGPDGTIKSASAGFAERATGDPASTLAGQDFVSFLRSDDRDRIFFAREGRRGTPQTLIHVPLDDPDDPSPTGPDEAQSLMLLVDSGVGIGSGWETSSQGVAQLEALLAQLPLGLAMTGDKLTAADAAAMGMIWQCVDDAALMDSAMALYQKAGFRSIDKPMGDTGHGGCDRYFVKSL